MKILNLLFILAGSIYLSCTASQSNLETNNPDFDELKRSIPLGYQSMKLISELKLVDRLPPEDVRMLQDWQIVPSNLNNILKHMELVESTEWYARCYMFERWYLGTVSNGEKVYKLLVCASGYITLSREGETLHFITVEDPLIFSMPCDCCE